MNPTGVQLILRKILELLDFDTLKICRLVCKTWEVEVNKLIRIPTEPFLLSEESIAARTSPSSRCNYISISNDLCPMSASDFIKRIYSANLFRIQFLEIRSPSWTWSQLEDILDLFEKLEELIFNGDFISPRTEEEVPHKKRVLRNLQTLYVNLKDEYLQNFVYTGFLQEMSLKAPNLQQIKFCSDPPFSSKLSYATTISSQVLFLNVLHGVSQLNLFSKLSSLCINFDMRNEDIQFLRNANLPLKKIHFSVDKTLLPSLIDDLLDSLGGSLVHLSITHRDCNRCVPKLDRLCDLEFLAVHDILSEGMTSRSSSEFQTDSETNEDGVSMVPSEAERRRSSVEFIPKSLLPSTSLSDGSVLIKMRAIQLGSIYFNETDVLNFPKYFPNLIKIQISYLSDDELKIIIKEFPRLEVLEAPEGLYTDVGLTGISPEIQDIFCNGVTNEVRMVNSMNDFPSIASLKCLQVLKLSSKNTTDFGVVNGIAYCETVFMLTLDFPHITDLSLRKIAANMSRLDHVHLMNGNFSNEAIREFQSAFRIPSVIFFNKRI